MAIDCDHPRPALNLPGYTPPRLAWQLPAYIPDIPPSAARVIREALSGVYQELTKLGATRNMIPLLESIEARPGSVISGVGDGQTITLLPPGAEGYLDPVSVLLTDVISPVSVLHPDGTVTTLGEAGAYDFLPAGAEDYETNPGGLILGGAVPTDSLIGRDSAGTGAAEFITVLAPLEFDGSGHIRIAADGFSVIGRAGTGTGVVAPIVMNDLSVLGRAGVLGTNVAGIDVPGTGTFTGESVFLRVASTRLGIQWRPWTLVDMPEMGNLKFVGNVSGATARPQYTDLAQLGQDLFGIGFDTATHNFKLSSILTDHVLANITGSTATPVAVPFSDLDSTSIIYDGTSHTFQRAALTGDVTSSQNSNSVTVNANAVTDAMLRDSLGLSVIGRAANSTGDPADIVAANDAEVLRRSGTTLGFGTVATAGLADNAVTNAKIRDSGALSVIGRSANSSGDPADISATAASDAVLRESGSVLGFGTVATGGITNNAVTDAKLRQGVALSVIGRSANSTGNVADIAGTASSDAVLRVSGTSLGFGTVATAGIADGAITNAKLANMAESTIKGRASGAGTGAPQDLTGAQTGQIVRFSSQEDGPSATGTYEPTIAANTTIFRVNPASGDELTFTGFSVTGGNSGKVILFLKQGADGRAVIKHDSGATAANGCFLADEQDFILTGANQACILWYQTSSGRWQVVGAKVADRDYGDITVTVGGRTWTIDNDVISDAKLRNSAALSVIGRSANSSGDPADISATAASDAVLRESGSVLGFGTVATGGITNNAVTDAKLRQGTALSVIGRSANSTGNVADIAAVAASGSVLRESGSTIGFGTIATAGIANNAVTNAKLATMAARTVKGRADSAGTGDPQDLTGAQLGEIVRFATKVDDSTSTGSVATYAIAEATCGIRFTGSAAITIHGATIPAAGEGKEVYWFVTAGAAAVVTIKDESASAGGITERFRTTKGADVVLTSKMGMLTRYIQGRHTVIAGPTVVPDADYGDITVSSGGTVWTIDNDVISNAKLRDSAALSVIGRSANSTGDPADIAAANDGEVLRRSGTTLGFGTVATAGHADNSITDAKIRQSAALTVIGNASNATANVADIGAGSDGFVLRRSGTALGFGTIATAGIGDDQVSDAKLRNSAALSVIGRSANSSGDPADIAAANDGEVLRRSGTTLGFGTVATAGITDAAVTLAKMANLAQSSIIGRAESAGTGVPQALTSTQVAAIIDGEPFTWLNTHAFNGPNLTASVSSDITLTAGGTTTLAAGTVVQVTSPFSVVSSLAFSTVLTSAATAANNLAIGSVTAVRFSGPVNPLTGMVPAATGQVVLLCNIHASSDVVILLENGSSTAANRFAGLVTDRHIKPGEMALAWYDGTSQRWRLLLRDDVDL